jgi:hypothetical protein
MVTMLTWAIVDLWSFQKSKVINSHSNLRGAALNSVLKKAGMRDGDGSS